MNIVPITFKEACYFVNQLHRHHRAPQGHKFSIALEYNDKVVGVAIVGRPVSRHEDNGFTLEVTRLCTDGTKNACSKLYRSCWDAAKALGYKRLITYILNTENGSSCRGAGFRSLGEAGGGSWNVKSRPRVESQNTQRKLKFEIT